jgi:hypothetical protein
MALPAKQSSARLNRLEQRRRLPEVLAEFDAIPFGEEEKEGIFLPILIKQNLISLRKKSLFNF